MSHTHLVQNYCKCRAQYPKEYDWELVFGNGLFFVLFPGRARFRRDRSHCCLVRRYHPDVVQAV
jgi:hypothetical protein